MKEYKHDTDHPSEPKQGYMMSGMGCHEFKGEADPIAYGQSGKQGCASDDKKIQSQMKQYHWE